MESGLGVACTADQWPCGDGQCVPASFRCDGATQCKNGADELECPLAGVCNRTVLLTLIHEVFYIYNIFNVIYLILMCALCTCVLMCLLSAHVHTLCARYNCGTLLQGQKRGFHYHFPSSEHGS